MKNIAKSNSSHGGGGRPHNNETLRAILQEKSIPVPGCGCLIWTGAWSTSGYGTVSICDRSRLIHRVAWELENGEVPAGCVVMHKCDTRPCINPNHLTIGTSSDNMQDMVLKGRHRIGTQGRFGCNHPTSKLTKEQAYEIRLAHARGESQRAIATRFGVDNRTINRLVRDISWRGV